MLTKLPKRLCVWLVSSGIANLWNKAAHYHIDGKLTSLEISIFYLPIIIDFMVWLQND